MNNYRITFGDTVRVSQEAPSHFRPDELGSVCGFRELHEGVEEPYGELKPRLCLVEFANGEAVEIPESYLIPSIDI